MRACRSVSFLFFFLLPSSSSTLLNRSLHLFLELFSFSSLSFALFSLPSLQSSMSFFARNRSEERRGAGGGKPKRTQTWKRRRAKNERNADECRRAKKRAETSERTNERAGEGGEKKNATRLVLLVVADDLGPVGRRLLEAEAFRQERKGARVSHGYSHPHVSSRFSGVISQGAVPFPFPNLHPHISKPVS